MKKESFPSGVSSLELFQKPEALAKKRVKLVRLNFDRAYFVDSEKRPWVFDMRKRLWREVDKKDALISIRDSGTTLPGIEQSEFKDVDDAMLYAMKKRFQYLLDESREISETLEEIIRDKEEGESKEKHKNELKKLYDNILAYENALDLLYRLEKSENDEEKNKLSQEFKDFLSTLSVQ